jgi:hypothetical protein
MPYFVEVDPMTLHLPPSRSQGAEPDKLRRQIARFGASDEGMPPPWVYQGSDGALMIYDGVTRATRVARLAPGRTIRVEVIGTIGRPVSGYPTVGEVLS